MWTLDSPLSLCPARSTAVQVRAVRDGGYRLIEGLKQLPWCSVPLVTARIPLAWPRAISASVRVFLSCDPSFFRLVA